MTRELVMSKLDDAISALDGYLEDHEMEYEAELLNYILLDLSIITQAIEDGE